MASGLASALTTCPASRLYKTNSLEWSWRLWEFLQLDIGVSAIIGVMLSSVSQCYEEIVRLDTRDDALKRSSFLRPGSPRASVMKLEDDEVKSLGHKMSALDGVNVYIYIIILFLLSSKKDGRKNLLLIDNDFMTLHPLYFI